MDAGTLECTIYRASPNGKWNADAPSVQYCRVTSVKTLSSLHLVHLNYLGPRGFLLSKGFVATLDIATRFPGAAASSRTIFSPSPSLPGCFSLGGQLRSSASSYLNHEWCRRSGTVPGPLARRIGCFGLTTSCCHSHLALCSSCFAGRHRFDRALVGLDCRLARPGT